MVFDLSRIVVPFRMQPGLSELKGRPVHLHALATGSPLQQERQSHARQVLKLPDFDDDPIRCAISSMAAEHGIPCPAPSQPNFWSELSLCVEEDFAVLDAQNGTVPLLQVCNPSRWAPEEKLGLSFAQIHHPVADSETIQRTSQALVQLVCDGRHWERFVWTLTPDPAYNQHPQRNAKPLWPWHLEAAQWSGHIFLRTERQTLFPVPHQGFDTPRWAVFTIRVMRERLTDWLVSAEHAQRLHDSVQSMSAAVLEYKGLGEAQAFLLRALREHSTSRD